MKYQNVCKGIFLKRPNRFVAKVLIEGKEEIVHVKNTGRCAEILLSGATVYLTENDSPNRKTRFDLIAVEKKRVNKKPLLINMDSQIPNAVVSEWLSGSGIFSEKAMVKREVFFQKSRFDLYVEDGDRRAFIEVKGVTLEADGVALFPDAPTLRGVKHIYELCEAVENGFEAYLIFLIQMKEIISFTPNRSMHPQFADALINAKEKGVTVLALDSLVEPNEIKACDFLPVVL